MQDPMLHEVVNWRHELHWRLPRFNVHNGWIAIKRLPLNFWNDRAFEMIGENLGV
ncbi:hypothetical protein Scep_025921 [Stephania cephalantha]|uniref:DUF4283 domain-containing protein n=1 Tax=Stephania cephalantha TaxID=152367 RepID=A0AAP0HRL5_9MAGN